MSKYKRELQERKKGVKKRIKAQEEKVSKLKFKTNKWRLEYRRLDDIRHELRAVNSRIQYVDKPSEGISELKVIV
jgi:hypothetical protein